MPESNRNRRLRYARNPEYRLRVTNQRRIRQGKRPYQRADEVGSEFVALHQKRVRDDKGRFI